MDWVSIDDINRRIVKKKRFRFSCKSESKRSVRVHLPLNTSHLEPLIRENFSFEFDQGNIVKYFFLSDSWTTGRVWEFGGLWNELAWNRKPDLQQQSLYIQENGENLWLYQVEEAVLMVEVLPKSADPSTIGQVVLKRLLSAEQVVERLCQEAVFHPPHFNIEEAIPQSPSVPAFVQDEPD